MAHPECRRGTYKTNGEKVIQLREASTFRSRDAFCAQQPACSIPTLNRAESGGCLFKATLQNLATKLGLSSWKELCSELDELDEPVFKDPVSQTWRVKRPFASFDETEDGMDIIEQVQLLMNRRIPFLVIAFNPANSVDIILLLERRDARRIVFLGHLGKLQPIGITEVFNPDSANKDSQHPNQ